MTTKTELAVVGAHFDLPGTLVHAEPFGSGHINDTWKVIYRNGRQQSSWLHQRINQHVFPDADRLMENIDRVSEHLQMKLAHLPHTERARRCLQVIPTRGGRRYYRGDSGDAWRTYNFVSGTRTFDVVRSQKMAYEAARAFGLFQRQLEDFPEPRLHETLAHFHDTPSRIQTLLQAAGADEVGRLAQSRAEVDFVLERQTLAATLVELHQKGEIPERVTHNDTKINNVLMDEESGEGICVVDLETVMPGLSLYDFGDLVRTASHQVAEDEPDLSRVEVDPELFRALVRGYWSQAGTFLNELEKQHLLTAGMIITMETGMRFLSDHLQGDRYFKVHHDGQNLDRCRTQFALVRSMERQQGRLLEVVAEAVEEAVEA
ncbi:MAG: aminoglycoside phosphotransferase family protein [Planctomycetota bacterium]|nr:MAG: aminoglycoside phosphotransferase family protein [Planctomycetota bacterium]